MSQHSATCPACKFPNFSGGTVCRLCNTSLPLEDSLDPDAPAPTTALGEVLLWLCCDPFQPVPLREKSPDLTVGRTAESEIHLPHHAISRCHGMIRVSEGVVRYEDASRHGSFLNGKRIETSALNPGDVLTIGPYDLEVRHELPKQEFCPEGTSEIDFTTFMSGLLEETSAMEVLQGLEFNAKTGTLGIISGQLRGTLVLRGGQPWYANLGDKLDDEAVLGILALTEGRYIFAPTPEDGERRMHTRLTGLLLEASRREDERGTGAHRPGFLGSDLL